MRHEERLGKKLFLYKISSLTVQIHFDKLEFE